MLILPVGLKAQHVSSIVWLTEATEAKVDGLFVGSKTIEFAPKLSPANLKLDRSRLHIKADSAASLLLVFQAILPFLAFSGSNQNSPITLHIQGGTNVSWSPSYEYLDQVLLPSLERFGIEIERKLHYRGWSFGTPEVGEVSLKLIPLRPGHTLKTPNWPLQRGEVSKIDITIIVPQNLLQHMKDALLSEIDKVFKGVEANLFLVEDSKHKARFYTLLVAHTTTGLRFGRDWLYDKKTKDKTEDKLSAEISQRVVNELDKELQKGGVIDRYLQDQLVVFQALAEGKSSIPSSFDALASDRERVDRTDEPFGDGSLHTTTARWVTSELLPKAKWIDKGRVCEGVGYKIPVTETTSKVENTLQNLKINH